MIKLKDLLTEKLKRKKSTFGDYIQLDFYDKGEHVGFTNIRLKKGWNQLHVNVKDEHQRKGYAQQFIEGNLDEYDYVVFPDDRVLNRAFFKVINKFKNKSKYDVFRNEKYDETIISNKKKSKDKILDKLK